MGFEQLKESYHYYLTEFHPMYNTLNATTMLLPGVAVRYVHFLLFNYSQYKLVFSSAIRKLRIQNEVTFTTHK
jgi:hypothetical protein